jgi:hypothetical protein
LFSVVLFASFVRSLETEFSQQLIWLGAGVYCTGGVQIIVTEEKRAWYHFVTTLCAIVGGVYVVAGMIDSLIHGGAEVLRKKLDLGTSVQRAL